MAVETAPYQIESNQPPFQIRQYPALVEATVKVDGTRDEAVGAGFRILAKYIFGGNQRGTKIAMTAPVLQTAAPGSAVTASASMVGGWDVTFIMPGSYRLATLPPADNDRIQLRDLPSRRMAVITFSGFWSDANLDAQQRRLLAFIEQHHLTLISGPVFAFYDPPWTPWFWRTNEVQYAIAP